MVKFQLYMHIKRFIFMLSPELFNCINNFKRPEHSKNKNDKFEQKLVEFDLAPRSHSSNTNKIKFNKNDWFTLT